MRIVGRQSTADTSDTYANKQILHTGNSNMTRLVSADTTPANNNEINWTYE